MKKTLQKILDYLNEKQKNQLIVNIQLTPDLKKILDEQKSFVLNSSKNTENGGFIATMGNVKEIKSNIKLISINKDNVVTIKVEEIKNYLQNRAE